MKNVIKLSLLLLTGSALADASLMEQYLQLNASNNALEKTPVKITLNPGQSIEVDSSIASETDDSVNMHPEFGIFYRNSQIPVLDIQASLVEETRRDNSQCYTLRTAKDAQPDTFLVKQRWIGTDEWRPTIAIVTVEISLNAGERFVNWLKSFRTPLAQQYVRYKRMFR